MKQISAFVKHIGTPNKNETDVEGGTVSIDTIQSEAEAETETYDEMIMISPNPVGKEGGILTAVRIRPLNTREIGSNSRIIVSNPGFQSQGIQIINPIFFKSSNQTDKLRKLEERGFSFDHTFWSLAGGNGVDKDEYASQEEIYNRIGKPIIQHALAGFNSSLFAYGQTGSGKTYTMMGRGTATATTHAANEVDSDDDDEDSDTDAGHRDSEGEGDGVIPRLCKDLLAEVTLLKSVPVPAAGSSSISSSSFSVTSVPSTAMEVVPAQEGQGQGVGQAQGSGGSTHSEHILEAHMRAAYYEIYNEKLYDLLAVDYEVPRKVREHATDGAYVEGLTYSLIQTYADIERILLTGQEKRQTAETKMNAESSRSHAIFVIQIAQKIDIRTPSLEPPLTTGKSDLRSSSKGKLTLGKRNGKKTESGAGSALMTSSQVIERKSKICLIDLAGSERLNTTGATGDRLKEATNINSSLSTLGEVIRKLSDKGRGKHNSAGNDALGRSTPPSGEQENSSGSGTALVHVPYRNSILTWILKDSLGGNSKTAIVATVSPSDTSYAESLNTLRYLERAKFVETNAVINENNSQDPYIKHLQHQLSAYKTKLNTALSQLRQQERQHKSALTAVTAELELLQSQPQGLHPHPHTPAGEGSPRDRDHGCNKMPSDALEEEEGAYMSVLKQLSGDDLAISLGGSECDGMDWGSSRSLGYSVGGESSVQDMEGEREGSHRFARSPSKRSLHESRGRTKEYFENECYDLQDALARSMAECNSLRTRLIEVDDLHDIEVEILQEELHSARSCVRDIPDGDRAGDDGDGGGGDGSDIVKEEAHSMSLQHKESSFSNLQVAIERLQMRLHEKDLELLAEKTLAQERVEVNNQLLFQLECDKDALQKTIRSAADSHDALLSDYNELAIKCAKVNAEKTSSLEQQESIVADLRGEIEVLTLVLASKEEIIVMHTHELSRKENDADKHESTHEDELTSLREVINMYKKELLDREERLAAVDSTSAAMQTGSVVSPPRAKGTESSLLGEVEDELSRIQEEQQEAAAETEALVRVHKEQVRALEEALASIKQRLMEEQESKSLCEEEWRARSVMWETSKDQEVARKEEELQQNFTEHEEVMLHLVQGANSAREVAEAEINTQQETAQRLENTLHDHETHIEELENHMLSSDTHLETLMQEWSRKEEHYEKVVHTLTDEIEVLEVDNATKNACLELFESQLVTQENELKTSQAKHEEEVHMLKIDADVMQIYLAAKEETIDVIEGQLAAKRQELKRLLADQQLNEEGLTIELESFKLALAGKEESHSGLLEKLEAVKAKHQQEWIAKLEQAQQHLDTIEAEALEEKTAFVMETEILKQDIHLKENSIAELRQSMSILTEAAAASLVTMAQKDEHIARLTTVDIPHLQNDLLAKQQEYDAAIELREQDRQELEQANQELHAELTARKELDAALPGKKSKFICF